MSNETKRDVVVDAVDALADAQGSGGDANLFMAEYDAALPDDLPVIPKAVGEYIKDNKDLDLLVALTIASNGYKHSELWIAMHQNVFSLAWVLEAWIVEETGEIVKVEEEK
jgi:hypothetical protein